MCAVCERDSMNPQYNFEKRYRLVREVIETIVLTVLMFLVIRFAKQNIIGRAALVYWPLQQDNDGFLPNVSAVYAHIHQSVTTLTPLGDGLIDATPFVLLAAPIIVIMFLHRRKNASSH